MLCICLPFVRFDMNERFHPLLARTDVCCSRGGLGTNVRMLTSLGLLLIDAAGVAVARPVAVIDTTGAWAWFWRIH